MVATVLDPVIYGQEANDILEIDFDYDNFWTLDDPNDPYDSFASDRDGSYADFQEWQAAGYNPHGIGTAAPYVDPAVSDFSLPSNTMLHDRGILIPGINDDYLGNAPDIGRYEAPGSSSGEPMYTLTVNYGSGDGSYIAGSIITINADLKLSARKIIIPTRIIPCIRLD